ncbi:hypothetical protein J6590_066078, partial [Homalodisca vitripennis]
MNTVLYVSAATHISVKATQSRRRDRSTDSVSVRATERMAARRSCHFYARLT